MSGLIAAINLARDGYEVVVHDREKGYGGDSGYNPSTHTTPIDVERTSEYVGIDLRTSCLLCLNTTSGQCFRATQDFKERKPDGEAQNGSKRLDFDAHLRLEFRGAKVTTDAGLLAVRELDEVLGLTEMAGEMLAEGRANNRRHDLTGLLRQSVYARLAGYEDVNDQEALSRDPAMRAVVGKKALERNAASSATVARFETEILAGDANLEALTSINRAWVKRAMECNREPRRSSWIWIPRSPQYTGGRRAPPTTATSSPSVTTLSSASTSTATARERL